MGTKDPAPTGSGAKSREKRRESFAASKGYDISTRQVVAIHTQRREKAAAPLAMAGEADSTVEKIAGRRKKAPPRFRGEAGPTG